MNITPEQAATLAENYVEPWEMPDCPDAVELWESAYDLAQTIAGMTEEWRCEANFDGTWAGLTTWESSPAYARATMQRRHRYPTRLVRRLVGPTEPVEVTE